MKTTLEEELITALSARAAALPTDVSEKLRAIDYHPRQHRRAAPVALGATAVGAAAAGTALVVALGGAAPAYAGWSAAPSAASSSPSSQVGQSCLGALPFDQPAGGDLGSGAWQPLLTDVRGPFTVALYQNNGAYMGCFTSSSFTQVTQVSSADGTSNGVLKVSGSGSGSGSSPSQGRSTVTVSGTSSGDLQNVVQSHLSTADGPYTLVDGRVASGVTGVTLVLDNGQDVVATVADGWLLAWWPSDVAATSSQVTNASGITSETLLSSTKGPPSPPAPGSCTPTTTPDGTNGVVHCTSSGGGRVGSGISGNSGSQNVTRAGISGNTGGTGTGPTKA